MGTFERINEYYAEYVVKHGVSAGWSSDEIARNSYAAAASFEEQQWTSFQSVLDVGSGQGHLMDFLRKDKLFTGHYTGLELLPMFHNVAVEKYGSDSNAEFIQGDFMEYDFGSVKFDWVASLGALSFKQENEQEQDAYDLEFCRKMIALAQYGITVYLNDIDHMRPGRLKEVPNLAAHKISDFVSMLRQNFPISKVEVMHYPTPDSQNTMVHAYLKS